MLPPAYDDALDAGLRALGIRLDAPARVAIAGHARLLIAWTTAINLTAIRDPAAIAVRHVVDSLTGLAPLRAAAVERFVDLGSGGGFPGLPLAAALPADQALLVDSTAKKVRFLRTVIDAVGATDRVEAAAIRAEELAATAAHRGRWPAVTARALAPLGELIELGLPLLRAGGVLVAWKSGDPEDGASLGGEIAAGRRAIAAIDPAAQLDVRPAIAGPADPLLAALRDHWLVVVERSRGPLADQWPRDPGLRRRAPWSAAR